MASFAGANQLNTLSAEPWNVHSAAAAVLTFFGLADLSEAASLAEAARLAEAAVASEAEEAPCATDTPDAARTPEAG